MRKKSLRSITRPMVDYTRNFLHSTFSPRTSTTNSNIEKPHKLRNAHTHTHTRCFPYGCCSISANSIKNIFTKHLSSLALKGADRCALVTHPLFPSLCFCFSHFAAQKHSHDNSYEANYEILSLITLMCDLSSYLRCG